jgi:hypothetical protein
MHATLVLLLGSLATATPPQPAVEGFVRVWVDPEAVTVSPEQPAEADEPHDLSLANPHVARSVVQVGDTTLGELDPRAVGVLHGVTPGVYVVRYTTPAGFERTTRVSTTAATAQPPPESSPPSAR